MSKAHTTLTSDPATVARIARLSFKLEGANPVWASDEEWNERCESIARSIRADEVRA